MRERVFVSLIIAALVCSAGSGGVAYAFGTSVVPGLGRTDPKTALTAMGGIITEARNPAFVLLLAAAAVNVPLNGRLNAHNLAPLTPGDAAREWQAYVEPWLVWNAVRCVAGLLGAVLFGIGLWRLARGREPAAVG